LGLRRLFGRTHAQALEPAPSEQELEIRRGLEALRAASARDVMTPRVDVVAIEAPGEVSDVVAAVRRSGHSHFPVYAGDLDHLVGVLFVKDLFHLDPETNGGGIGASRELTDRLREPYLVPESRSALEILADMRRGRRSFAVVVDEHGGFAGVLTIKDLVSELVGDIRDEYDRASGPSVVRIDTRRFLVDGACAIHDVNEALGTDLPEGEYVTLAGFCLDVLGHLPDEGEKFDHQGWVFTVSRMDRRRIAKVVVETPSATIPSEAAVPRSGK
jgi:putative hemolysin